MSTLLATLRQHATLNADRIALSDGVRTLDYAQLQANLDDAFRELREQNLDLVGLLADNGIAWITADLGALAAALPLLPLPLFFSPQQVLHTITTSGMRAVLTDRAEQLAGWLREAGIDVLDAGTVDALGGLSLLRLAAPIVSTAALPSGTCKITFTSGTTGTPKGVCLSLGQIEAVATSLHDATAAHSEDVHVCLTPLSTLLENIGGVYVPLLAGARVHVPPLAHVGLRGAAGLDPLRMVQALADAGATSAIMVPQMLQAMLAVVERGVPVPARLRFVAVGGAPVAERLLRRAAELSIPVFEGYGLSECASVVALNTPQAHRIGSVGRPLPHLRLRFADDGEILVAGTGFLGYLGDAESTDVWATGDLGRLDAEGYLHLQGRKKSIFITSFGRNVAPEWVERELTAHPAIMQAAVFGESRPFNVAVITPASGATDNDVQAAIDAANRTLPDYARVRHWVAARQAFTLLNQQLTSNGRPRRASIWSAHRESITPLYEEELHGVL